MPDYLSVYSEIYTGFTLRAPYIFIPLLNGCEQYYSNRMISKIKTDEDILDLTRDAPCPPSPYGKIW